MTFLDSKKETGNLSEVDNLVRCVFYASQEEKFNSSVFGGSAFLFLRLLRRPSDEREELWFHCSCVSDCESSQ